MKKFNEYKTELKQKYNKNKILIKQESKSNYFKFADWLEAYVDKKLGRFYVTREEHEEAKRLFIHEVGIANQKMRQLEMERDALMLSAMESRRAVENLSENAKKLLQLNNELKELLRQDMENESVGPSGSEVIIRSMKSVRNKFGKKPKRRR